MADDIKSLRVTVLGPAASGKTCLINAYVNNTCPNVYTPTEDPTLYYRTLRAEKDDKLITVLLEIEDTYSSNRTDGKDRFARNRSVTNFVAIKKTTNIIPVGKDGQFSSAPAPKENSYEPLSKGRMAFVILFDVNDPSSFAAAQEVYRVLNERHGTGAGDKTKVGTVLEPIVYLVGNKIDQDPHGEEPAKVKKMAKDFENENQHSNDDLPIRYMEVSALEFTKVRRLFRSMVDETLDRPDLWAQDGEKLGAAVTAATTWGGLFGGGSKSGGGGGYFGGLFGGGQ